MVIGVGVAWSTSLAVLGAFWKPDLTFVRTPKFGIGPAGGHWRGKGHTDHPRGGGAGGPPWPLLPPGGPPLFGPPGKSARPLPLFFSFRVFSLGRPAPPPSPPRP